jgi:UDP-glucose 4-epimerase
MRYLITGGAGFIGSHLTETLLAAGAGAIVLDDLSGGSRANLAAVEAHPGLRIVIGDAASPAAVGRLLRECDAVLHLAAAVGVQRTLRAPLAMLDSNVLATRTVLAAAAEQGKKVLLVSSSEVYGRGARVPFAEDDELVLGPTGRPRGAYGCAKALGEWWAAAHAAESGLPVVIARLFNTVGPRQSGRHGMVLPRFVRQALRGEPITVYGDGRQTRCFAHVRDVVDALLRLLAEPRAVGAVCNVGSDHEVSIRELAEAVRAAAGSAAPIVHVPYARVHPSLDDVPRRVPSLARLMSLTGSKPATPLARIVADVVAAHRAGEGAAVTGCAP